MAKNVTSRDPRKPAIVELMKAKIGASKITLLSEVRPGVFQAQALSYRSDLRYYTSLGTVEVTYPGENNS